jgi:threonine synthase
MNPVEQCSECEQEYEFDLRRWQCDCGCALNVTLPPFDPSLVESARRDMWRYRAVLPVPSNAQPVTLGEGGTPLVPLQAEGVYVKCETLNPTGSFKDRGMSALVTALAALGASEVVEDSSGNAGAALAAYAARAGLPATIYAPANAPAAKLKQIEAYGANLIRVNGSRQDVARVTQNAVTERGASYASHVWQPINLAGQATTAFEIWEQFEQRAPDVVVTPVGHATLLLGLYWGFCALRAAKRISKVPRLVGAQPEACAPLVDPTQTVWPNVTIADGARIAQPVRRRQIQAAIGDTGGKLAAIPEKEIGQACDKLARQGIYVEPTSALAIAALDHFQRAPGETVVAVLTGHGLKSARG